MANDKVKLNPEQFALSVLGGNARLEEEENKRYIKRQLTLYLEAYLLAQDFNDLEETQFELARENQRTQILEKLIERRYR
ncbi:MAG TPA: hypothetical protein VGM95_01440 [Lactobacillaceae bacterium]|jgi:shikimate kinase